MNKFSPETIEKLEYYIYVLIDPRDSKIFYVGKGSKNRIFDHVADALKQENQNIKTDKFDVIRDIYDEKKEVKHYIIRHGLKKNDIKEDEDIAYIVESVLIDFLTFKDFSEVAKLTNRVAGFDAFDRGIKTVEQLESDYNCKPIEKFEHNILAININQTYGINSERHPNIYQATRKSWPLNLKNANKVDLIFSEYHNIVRAIFIPDPNNNNKWNWTRTNPDEQNKRKFRYAFDGIACTDENILDKYIGKSLPKKKKGDQKAIHYLNKYE